MHWIDWLIVCLPVIVIAIIGVKTQKYVKGVAGFLAGDRSAGRYLLATSEMMASIGLISVVALFEMYYKSGASVAWWKHLLTPISLAMALSGFVLYRYRETRVLTMAQFFEVRYSKRFRVFAGVLAAVSGIANYGIFPAVGGRFFVYFCGLPETFPLLGLAIPTFAVIMLVFLSIALFLVLLGGQLTVMVTDCVQGMFSYIIYLVVAVACLVIFDFVDLREALSVTAREKSLLHPFHISGMEDFNIWFVLILLFATVYKYMSWQGTQGFNCAAISPHEAKMGRIVGGWKSWGYNLMILLLVFCAYTYMHHPRFAMGAARVQQSLTAIDNPKIQEQMLVSMALADFLPIGVKGAFCALMFFLMITTDVSYLHSWGSIIIQDCILPFRKRPLSPERHLLLLRLSITGVAIYAFLFSLLFRQTEYIFMFMAITGAIYGGGAGSAIIGGFYWKKGTTAGAWSAMLTGAALAVTGIVARQLDPAFPLNGQVMLFISMATAIVTYVVVSLLTRRGDFNMDQMLHRGDYRLADDPVKPPALRPRRSWRTLVGIDENFTRGDRFLAYLLFFWTSFWFLVWAVITLWNCFWEWPLTWFAYYQINWTISFSLAVGIITSVWLLIGGIWDLRRLFRRLKATSADARDDGRVAEPPAATPDAGRIKDLGLSHVQEEQGA